MYRNDDLRDPWLWQRISPQLRNAIPSVAVSDMAVAGDGAVVALAGSGDGGALLRSTDLGTTWQSIVIPGFPSVAGMALLGNIIAVVPDSYTPGQPPGRLSVDGGATWAPMGALPDPPRRGKLVPVLSAEAAEGALVLDLMSGTTASGGVTVARYVSRDGGRTWSQQ